MRIKKTFIAEKPSLAEDIAMARAQQLGVTARKVSSAGCWEVGDERVAYFFGHMFDSAAPKDYGPQWLYWNMNPIIIPEGQWKRKPYDDKRDHIRLVTNLVKSSDALVNAGDPAREGQLLVDEALLEMGVDPFAPNVERLWAQSLVRKDLLASLSSMRPNAERRHLFDAAFCRQRADFQHGMTHTRVWTIKARQGGAVDTLVSVGRVQTPTLALVVARDRERLRFKPVDHFQPNVQFVHENGTFSAAWVIPPEHDGVDIDGRLIDRAEAQKLVDLVSGKAGKIAAWKAEIKTTPPPLPFSLSALQATAGNKFSLTADEVLQVVQSLYDKKLTTYPRTDSRYLPVNLLTEEAPGIVRQLSGTEELGEAARGSDLSLKSAAWDDSKYKDHYAIIPTTGFTPASLSQMSDIERRVFLVIARAFLAQFRPPFKFKAVSTEVSCEGHKFRASGRQVIDQGWKKLYGADDDEDEPEDKDAPQSLPAMAQGDGVTATKGELVARKTKAPPPITDPILITMMANIHKFETNPEHKKQLRDGEGIGTEATRAATIKTLLDRGYIKRKGKTGKDKITLESTEFGRSIIDILPDDLKSAALTAVWERGLAQVEKGELPAEKFMAAQARDMTAKVEQAKTASVTLRGVKMITPLPGHGKPCPKCGTGNMITLEGVNKETKKPWKLLACSRRPDCDMVEFPEPVVEPLPGEGKKCPLCADGTMRTKGIVSRKDGKVYRLLVCKKPGCKGEEWPPREPQAADPDVEPMPGDGKKCPACGKGTMRTKGYLDKETKAKKRRLSCDNWKECKNVEWDNAGREGSPKGKKSK